MLSIRTHILDQAAQLGATFYRDGANGHAVEYTGVLSVYYSRSEAITSPSHKNIKEKILNIWDQISLTYRK